MTDEAVSAEETPKPKTTRTRARKATTKAKPKPKAEDEAPAAMTDEAVSAEETPKPISGRLAFTLTLKGMPRLEAGTPFVADDETAAPALVDGLLRLPLSVLAEYPRLHGDHPDHQAGHAKRRERLATAAQGFGDLKTLREQAAANALAPRKKGLFG